MSSNILHTGVAIGLGMCLMALFSQPDAQANLPLMSMGYGQNPLASIGGTAYDGENKLLMTAPGNHDLIVTDVILTSTTNVLCSRTHKSEFILGSGPILGQFETSTGGMVVDNGTWGTSNDGGNIQHGFTSGLRVPAGDTLSLMITETSSYTYNGSCAASTSHGVRYMVSGYYVNPM